MLTETIKEKRVLTHTERKLFANTYGSIIRDRRWMWRNLHCLLKVEDRITDPGFSKVALKYMISELELELDHILENTTDLLHILLASEGITEDAKLFYYFK